MASMTLAQIAALAGCPAPARGADRVVVGVAMLESAREDDLSFLGADRYLKQFARTKAAGVIVARKVHLPPDAATPVLLVDDADLAIAKVLEAFAPPPPRPRIGVDPAARVDPAAQLGADVAIAHHATVGAGARIGARTVLHPGVSVGDDVVIGADCQLFAGVVVRERIQIGDRVIIHANSVLGTDGFGYRWDGGRHVKIPQIGTVIIEDDVEIG